MEFLGGRAAHVICRRGNKNQIHSHAQHYSTETLQNVTPMFNCVRVAYKKTVSLTFSVKPELVLMNIKQVFELVLAHTELLANSSQSFSVFVFYVIQS